MHRLHQKFGAQIDFIVIDVDDLAARPTRMSLGMRNRSHYMLIDAEKNRLAQWFGPLDEATMFEQLGTTVATPGG